MGEIAGIQSYSDRLVTLALELFEDRDRVRDAALERIHRIHEEDAVVRIDLCVRPERPYLALFYRHEELYHAVRVRALGRKKRAR